VTVEFISHTRDERDLLQKIGQVLTRPWRKLTNGRTVHVFSSASTGNKEFAREVKNSLFLKIKDVFWKVLAVLALPLTICTNLIGKATLHYSDSYALMFAKYKQGKQSNLNGEYEAVRLQFHSVKLAEDQKNYPIEFKDCYEYINKFAKDTVLGENETYAPFKKGFSITIDGSLFVLPSHMVVEKGGAFHLICPMKAYASDAKAPKAHVYSFSSRNENDDYKEVAPKLKKEDLMRLSWEAFHQAAPQSTFKHFHNAPSDCIAWKDQLENITLASFTGKPEQLVMIKTATCQPKTAVSVCYRDFDSSGKPVLQNQEIPSSETFVVFIGKLRAIQLKVIANRAQSAISCVSVKTEEESFKKFGDVLIVPKSDESFELKCFGSPKVKTISYNDSKALEEIRKFVNEYCESNTEEIFNLLENEIPLLVPKGSKRNKVPSDRTFINHRHCFFVERNPQELYSKGLKICFWEVNKGGVEEVRLDARDIAQFKRRLKALKERHDNEQLKTEIRNDYTALILPVDGLVPKHEELSDKIFIELGDVSPEDGSVNHTLHFYNPFKGKPDSKKIVNPSIKDIEAEIGVCQRMQLVYTNINSIEGVQPLSPDDKPVLKKGSWFLQPRNNYAKVDLHHADKKGIKWCFSIDSEKDLQAEFQKIKVFFDTLPKDVPILKSTDPEPTVDMFKNDQGFDFSTARIRLDANGEYVEVFLLNPASLKVDCCRFPFEGFSNAFQEEQRAAKERFKNLVQEIKERFKSHLIEERTNLHLHNMSQGTPQYYLSIDEKNASIILHFWNKVKIERAQFIIEGYDKPMIEKKIAVVQNCHRLQKELNSAPVLELLRKNGIFFSKADGTKDPLTYKNFVKKAKAFYTVSDDYTQVTLYYLNPHNAADVLTFRIKAGSLKEGIERCYLARKTEALRYEFSDSFFKAEVAGCFIKVTASSLERARQRVFRMTLSRISKDEDAELAHAKKVRYAEDLKNKKVNIQGSDHPVSRFSEQKLYSGICRSSNEVYAEFKSRVSLSDYFDAVALEINTLMKEKADEVYDEFLDHFDSTLLTAAAYPDKWQRLQKTNTSYLERLQAISKSQERGDGVISGIVVKLMLNFKKDLQTAASNPAMKNPAGEHTPQDSLEKTVAMIYWSNVIAAAPQMKALEVELEKCQKEPLAGDKKAGDKKAEKLSSILLKGNQLEMQVIRTINQSVRHANHDLIVQARQIMLREKRQILKDIVIKEKMFEFDSSDEPDAGPIAILRNGVRLLVISEKQVRSKDRK